MNKITNNEKLLSRYATDRKQVLFFKAHFVVFSQEKHADLVIIGRCQARSKGSLYFGSALTATPPSDCLNLWSKVEELSLTKALTSFSLSAFVMQRLKEAIKNVNATHLRFYNEGNALKIVLFDYVKFHARYRLTRKISQAIRYHETSVVVRENFSITLLASSFDTLPCEYLDFRIGENGVCQVNYAKNDLKYLMRDQKLIEPMTTFSSPRLSKKIALVLEPTME